MRTIVLALASLGALAACAMPPAHYPPVVSQAEVRSVQHWRGIADDMFTEMSPALAGYAGKPIAVETGAGTDFERGLGEFLMTRLTGAGHPVVMPEDAAVVLALSSVVVMHEVEPAAGRRAEVHVHLAMTQDGRQQLARTSRVIWVPWTSVESYLVPEIPVVEIDPTLRTVHVKEGKY
jgi:hypothetical protein